MTGVPQGSVLGPLIFLIYINDIHTCSNKLSFYLFADDTNLLYADKNLKYLESSVNTELQNVCDWLNAKKLTLNTKKWNFVVFRPKQKKLNYLDRLRVQDNNGTNGFSFLQSKDYVKFQGVFIDKRLTWKNHIDFIASKISKLVGVIARLRHNVPLNTLLQIYRALIFPYTSYGIAAWGQAAQCHLKKIFIPQKRALRLIFFPIVNHMLSLFLSLQIFNPWICSILKQSLHLCTIFQQILYRRIFLIFLTHHLTFIPLIPVSRLQEIFMSTNQE